MGKLKAVIRGLLAIVGPPKDDSPEAGLSGDLDEIPQTKKKKGSVVVEEVTEDD